MAYQVLARKWRPKTFSDLVGQEHVVKALQNALDEGRLHHAYLLTGTRGVGKTTIARILAKSLNCENAQHGEPCGVCESCTQIDAGRYVDLLEIDAASNTGIDNIREVLENAQYAPTAGKIQSLYHRRSAYAFQKRVQRYAQNAGRAARTRQIHPCHDRSA
ncbi:AAA family ATPase [Neisseria meningitidis]|uniref:AAA family ATPase n=1 Tax=Neisseria meningitidis TaxID=487 RepID=UPI0030ED40B0